jgi:hypothetical protein
VSVRVTSLIVLHVDELENDEAAPLQIRVIRVNLRLSFLDYLMHSTHQLLDKWS